ncbi:MAG: hypothetical protein ABGX05_17405, partial [Pirellulaceae bacterium]
AMMSALVLAHKPTGSSLSEKLIRLLAWLTLIKVVLLFWVPALRELSITYMHKVPPSLLRIEGVVLSAIGPWLIYWGTQAMRDSSEKNTD